MQQLYQPFPQSFCLSHFTVYLRLPRLFDGCIQLSGFDPVGEFTCERGKYSHHQWLGNKNCSSLLRRETFNFLKEKAHQENQRNLIVVIYCKKPFPFSGY